MEGVFVTITGEWRVCTALIVNENMRMLCATVLQILIICCARKSYILYPKSPCTPELNEKGTINKAHEAMIEKHLHCLCWLLQFPILYADCRPVCVFPLQ
jgi:hypothetical protein